MRHGPQEQYRDRNLLSNIIKTLGVAYVKRDMLLEWHPQFQPTFNGFIKVKGFAETRQRQTDSVIVIRFTI